ncbi:MAG TPA: tRNA (guanosine(46)-N7)-methyltransferase TrmB [Steroidobacteraceae bacterium]|nr:tRNA (guanosine(46)-N7)-methyltransferase TrmB [Steroidobacteraceae bacterium]
MTSQLPPAEHPRSIRSFVVRGGRTTDAQRRALEELWPRYGVDLSSARLDLDVLFGRRAPRTLEIGFGNGENLIALAASHPERDYLGIEVHPPGVGRLLLATAAAALTNVRIVCHDAVQVLESHIAPGAIEEVLILFPDPWPKKRHHKRRIVQPPFAACLAERLARGGVVRLATDWQPYAEHMLEVLGACATLENLSPEGAFVARAAERATTRFERRGERLGHAVWELAFRRR